ncbi:MAG TPA: ABC transporter substrate-binding protein [Allosphingosinicella sp.]|nr:ABC transporter substrate-binding protein [Allosphingosinicella sp.]
MRVFASLSAISLALAAVPADAAPRRVASLNLCTDELVLLLAAPEQIASVTHLSQQAQETPLWRAARNHARNDGSLLSVVPLRPDLIVTMGGGGRDRLRIAERLGIPTLDLPFAQSLGDVAESIRRLALALGREEQGIRLLRSMAALIRSAPAATRDTIWLGGGGRTVAASGLEAQWMRLAGLRQRPMQGDRVSLETLILAPPAILLRSDYRAGQNSAGQRWLTHPAARMAGNVRTLATDGRAWTCMGPLLIGEIARLRREAGR